MAFSNDQRAKIRLYMGMSRLFTNSNTVLESAMTAIDNLNDGGSTETAMIATLANLAALEANIATQQTLLLVSEVTGDIKIDAARALAVLRKEGQSMINGLSFPLSMKPFQRYFYPSDIDDSGDAHVHRDY